tara:strand:+ start:1371 stop:1529 length:159 start_codon:yes stop_codon:yes gene_type:complete
MGIIRKRWLKMNTSGKLCLYGDTIGAFFADSQTLPAKEVSQNFNVQRSRFGA